MPFEDISDDRVRQQVLTSGNNLLHFMAAGMVAFLVVVLVLRGTPNVAAEPDMVTYVSAGFFLVMLVVATIIPRSIAQAQIAQIARGTWNPPEQTPANYDVSSESAKLLMAYQTQMIVRLAMFEGAGFFGLVAYQLEGHWLALGVGIAALALLLSQFPTRGRVESWADHAQGRMQAIRQWPRRS